MTANNSLCNSHTKDSVSGFLLCWPLCVNRSFVLVSLTVFEHFSGKIKTPLAHEVLVTVTHQIASLVAYLVIRTIAFHS